MRKYVTKILCVLAIVLVFGVSFFAGMEKDITKLAAGIIADSKLDDSNPCTSGNGTEYYVTANDLNIRESWSQNSASKGKLNKCTKVTVYCENKGWSKISKVANLWVSSNYLNTKKPQGCKNWDVKTTATKKLTPITYNLSSPKYTYAEGMDKMYSNKPGKIRWELTNVKNLANDDDDLIRIVVYQGQWPNNKDVTDKFNVKIEYSNGKGYIELTQRDPNMDATKYLPSFYIGTQYNEGWGGTTANVKYSEFTIVGKYYDFSIIQEESYAFDTNMAGNPSSEKNEFLVKITDLVDATNYDKFTYKIFRVDDNGKETEATDKFKVQYPNEMGGVKNKNEFYFYNYYDRESKRPLAGNYKFVVYYEDSGYSTARGKISDSWEFSIANRAVVFERKDIYSQRYVRSKQVLDYAIQIKKMPTEDGVQYIEFIESNRNVRMTVDEFKSIYTDCDLSVLEVDYQGRLQHSFANGTKHLVHYNPPWNVTYYDDNNNWPTENLDEFERNYPGVLAEIQAKYVHNSDGNVLNYVVSGKEKIIKNKYLAPDNQLIFAAVGGVIKFTYRFENIYDEDFQKAKITIKRDDGTVVTKNEGFSFDWRWDTNKGEVVMYLTYDNENEDYAGDYTIYIEMTQIDIIEVPFTLYDGEVDFYLTSQIDSHLETSKPLATQYPPGNQRYEYYVGFYLVKSGAVLNTKNAKMIDVRIYDHLVDLDENGEMFYYDQIDYEIRVQSLLNDLITYQVALNNGAFTTVTDEPLATFTSKYSQAASVLDMYTYDETTGAITGNKFELNITRYYNDESIGDMQVVFTDSTGVETTMPLQEFKVTYPDMYAYLITRFVFDEEDNIIQGGIIGNYRVTEYNGEPIEGAEMTSLFDITIDPAADNVEKPIKILPKTEVDAGEYFVYVTYDNLQGVGFVNNADDAVISKELFPEMWEQNTHMTSIIYIDPEYSLDVHDAELSNEGNDSLKIYNNIKGKAHFDIDYNSIYNYDGVTYKIEFFNGTTWVDASDRFIVTNSIDPESTSYNIKEPFIELDTIVQSIQSGKYRLTVDYENKGFTATDSAEFEIGGKYYGLLIEDGTVIEFVHNFQETKTIMAKTIFVNETGNIIPSITRKITGGTNEILTRTEPVKNAQGKMEGTFVNSLGVTVFTYQYNVDPDYYPSENETLYEFLLTNVADVTDVGNYELSFTYQEGTNDVSTSSIDFAVIDDQYFYQLSNEKPVANETGMYLYMDIDTRFINYEDLDDMYYIIYYYNFSQGKYVDVSSATSDNKMFDITDSWDASSGPNYKGTLKISINEALVDMGGDYYIEAFFKDTSEEFDIGNLRKLFSWGISDLVIGSIYTEKEIIDGEEEITEIQLDAIYKNLGNANIDITIESVYENDVQWVINKNCISDVDVEQCSPEGTNYNSRFEAINTTGQNGRLKLTLKEGLTDKEMLEPGEYTLMLYYSSDNFNYVNFDVYSEYADIIITENFVYTEITSEKVVDGLYKNKDGVITLYTKLRGIDYDTDLINIDITDAMGNKSYMKNFILDTQGFAPFPHELVFNYDSSTELPAGTYMIKLTYDTVDGLIYDTFEFEMNPEYFNFYIYEPTYNPNPLYPNLENGGTATFVVETEDIPNVFSHSSGSDSKTEKHVFAKNARIYDEDGNDVTEYFTITAANHIDSVLDSTFHLNVSFEKNAVAPGIYTIRTSYEMYDYIVTKTQKFEIGGYKKDFKIKNLEIITDTRDERIHNNTGGIYRFHIETDFQLFTRGLNVSVIHENGTDVTSYFETMLNASYIDLKYNPTMPYIDPGKLTVTFTYQETAATDIFTTGQEVTMYGRFVDLTLSNLKKSTDELYSDLPDQYVMFDLTSASIKEEQKDDVEIKVFDAEGNDVTSAFKLTNLYPTGGNIKLDIIPFKSRIGVYTIQAFLKDEVGDNNISNELKFEIEYNYYHVRYSTKSTINSVNAYEGDTTKIYDIDGADVFYQFVTNYQSTDYSEFSIKIYQGLKLIKEIDADFLEIREDGVKYVTTDFLTGELAPGKYDVAVAINGLPYNWKTITVSKYVPVTKATIYMNGIAIEDKVTVYKGQIINLSYTVEPANATNKEMKFASSNKEMIFVDNDTNRAFIYGEEPTQITLSNKDITTTITVEIDDRLSSETYKIDYEKHIIYIDSIKAYKLGYEEFMNNLNAVVIGHKVLDKDGVDITGQTSKNIGTSFKLVNGAETYTVALIGDINRDGKISLADVANLLNYVSGNTELNEAQILAGRIRKTSAPKTGDVAKLFNFVTSQINEL